ncbi:MAG TPA: MobQ family relaxase [Steroidobacteraceae bacterium]|jgi:ATP-dependent exoDNAse (exonuclease V) alpha subunit|nr:MobQ family relaxase [Steroidobacteraceae bacterium]
MAIFRLQITPVTRGTGRTATSAAAYRAGERISDERTGAVYDHGKRGDVLHKEILLPSRLDRTDAATAWARDRSALWNAAEKAERQSNSRVAREYQVALPAELSAEQRVTLARTFSREIADRYNVAVDLAIHAPRPEGDPRNFHAHLLATTREVTPEGLGPKTGLDMEGGIRSELGLPPSREEFKTLRARWAELTNGALQEANIEARVDHRTLEAQGIDRAPMPYLPKSALVAERRGEHSEVADRIRERQRQRLSERKKMERSVPGTRAEGSADAASAGAVAADAAREKPEPRREAAVPQDMDARRQQAVRDWLEYRAASQRTTGSQGNDSSPPRTLEEIRRQAVEAWRGLQARGVESQLSTASGLGQDAGRDRREADQGQPSPGMGEDFSA